MDLPPPSVTATGSPPPPAALQVEPHRCAVDGGEYTQ